MQTAQFVSRLSPRKVRSATLRSEMDDASESSKQFLERLFYSKSDRLVIKANDKGKNPMIWSKFDMAYIDGVEQKYACCKLCNSFIKYTGRTGTGGLMRHFCYKKFHWTSRPQRGRPMTTTTTSDYEKTPSVRLQIESLIQKNSPRIGYVRNTKGKSEVWSQFKMITVDNVLSNFACCIVCRSLVTYMSRTGTGSMTRHKCPNRNHHRKFADGDQGRRKSPDPVGVVIKSEESFDWDERTSSDGGSNAESNWTGTDCPEGECKQEAEEPEIPTEVEKALHEKHLAVANKSLRLLNVFENSEFMDLAQFLVDLGARYGRMDVKKIFKQKINLIALHDD